MQETIVERIYAGWLGKLIGVRLGAPVESWSRERIAETYHGQHGYLVDYQDFAADDDVNGPVFFIRAARDSGHLARVTSEDVGRAWLQYASWGHGMFWWGGYGVASEHTAYENLRAGMSAPASGSCANAGRVLSEQIGGQIFIDTWGLVCPERPAEAARLAGIAVRVAHDGEAVVGGSFVAACIAAAFNASSVDDVLDAALLCIPAESQYAQCVRRVRAFHAEHPNDPWACYDWIHETCWVEQWQGNCHILPNAALMILALCYGGGDFGETLELCNRCGFDTDCNAGNIGTIMGVLTGLSGIGKAWRAPINDFFVCSSALGSLNITDAASFTRELCRLAADMGHLEPDARERAWLKDDARVSFFLPGSTCGVRVTSGGVTRKGAQWVDGRLCIPAVSERSWAWIRTYVQPENLHDDRYQPAFSPLCYPAQTVQAVVSLRGSARIRAMDTLGGTHVSDWVICHGETTLTWTLPSLAEGCFCKLGVEAAGCAAWELLSLTWHGEPEYALNTACLRVERWARFHTEISQFTNVKGYWYLEDGALCGEGSDVARMLTGGDDWRDYRISARVSFRTARSASLLVRVTGAMRCCGVRVSRNGDVSLFREDVTRTELCACAVSPAETAEVSLAVNGCRMTVFLNGQAVLTAEDDAIPAHGCIGLDVTCPGACAFTDISVRKR